MMTALFAVLAIDAYQASKDHLVGVMAALRRLVCWVAPQSMLLISMVVPSAAGVAFCCGLAPQHPAGACW